MLKQVMKTLKDDGGATMVEYAIMVSLIAAICITVVNTLGTTTRSAFNTVNASL